MKKLKNYSLTNQGHIMSFSSDSLLNQQSNLYSVQTLTLSKKQQNHMPQILSSASAYSTIYDHEEADTVVVSHNIRNSSPKHSTTVCDERIKNFVGNKRKRNNNDVIHVRAKRGQATDSHSLAERVRREKINEKLRCLQDMVPGCYKAMGMAVMLDVIINYVQSMQQQIELSAASMYFDFNTSSQMDATKTIQQRSVDTHGIHEMETTAGEGYGGFCYFNPTWPLY